MSAAAPDAAEQGVRAGEGAHAPVPLRTAGARAAAVPALVLDHAATVAEAAELIERYSREHAGSSVFDLTAREVHLVVGRRWHEVHRPSLPGRTATP